MVDVLVVLYLAFFSNVFVSLANDHVNSYYSIYALLVDDGFWTEFLFRNFCIKLRIEYTNLRLYGLSVAFNLLISC